MDYYVSFDPFHPHHRPSLDLKFQIFCHYYIAYSTNVSMSTWLNEMIVIWINRTYIFVPVIIIGSFETYIVMIFLKTIILLRAFFKSRPCVSWYGSCRLVHNGNRYQSYYHVKYTKIQSIQNQHQNNKFSFVKQSYIR